MAGSISCQRQARQTKRPGKARPKQPMRKAAAKQVSMGHDFLSASNLFTSRGREWEKELEARILLLLPIADKDN